MATESSTRPYRECTSLGEVNWSDDLEALHEEDSRNHFLDVATRRALLSGITDSPRSVESVIDLGCSTGYLLEDMRKSWPDAKLYGVDLVPQGLVKAHENVPDAELLRADVCQLPLDDESVDAAVSANLLEHVPDDERALREAFRVLRPGARFGVVVPAAPGLYDYYDRYLQHERRYARHELAEKGRSAGFRVITDTHIGSLIFPAFWAQKKLNRVRHADIETERIQQLVARDIKRTKGSKLGALTMRIEDSMRARGLPLPVGIRSYVLFEKP